ncbi:MAG: TraR/DksA family transcriptional regulator [Kofleriaceae bacterium]|nr:TraR/DksA family transcriptional regulator [Kofleriaceae bacterium]
MGERNRLDFSSREVRSFSRDRDKSRIGSDSIDESAAELVIGTHLRLADQDNDALKQVLRALDLIEKKSYGTCEDCQEPISWPRLRAFPATTLCIECKEDQEDALRLERELE